MFVSSVVLDLQFFFLLWSHIKEMMNHHNYSFSKYQLKVNYSPG